MSEQFHTVWGTVDAQPVMTLAELVARLKESGPAGGHYILGLTVHVHVGDSTNSEPEFDIWCARTQRRWKGCTIAGAWAAFAADHQPNPLPTLSRELEACNAAGVACTERV